VPQTVPRQRLAVVVTVDGRRALALLCLSPAGAFVALRTSTRGSGRRSTSRSGQGLPHRFPGLGT
jgi:hypothetical protein